MVRNLSKKVVKKPVASKFRISSKKLFLTYSQTNLSPKDLLEGLKVKFEKNVITDYVISSEYHADQKGKHLHVFLEMEKKIDIRTNEFLHIKFNKDTNTEFLVKGNYQGCKNKIQTINYILKDVFDTSDENQIIMSPNLRDVINDRGVFRNYESVMIEHAEEGRIDQAMRLLKMNSPSMYMRSHMSIEKSMRNLFLKSKGLKQKFSLDSFDVPSELSYLLGLIEVNELKESIWLKGDSSTGKTQFILSFLSEIGKNPLVINDLNSIGSFVEGRHDVLVLDDMEIPGYISREKLLKLLDSQDSATFDVKHASVKIPESTPRIFTSNLNLSDYVKSSFIKNKEITRRFIVVDIKDKSLIRSHKSDYPLRT